MENQQERISLPKAVKTFQKYRERIGKDPLLPEEIEKVALAHTKIVKSVPPRLVDSLLGAYVLYDQLHSFGKTKTRIPREKNYVISCIRYVS